MTTFYFVRHGETLINQAQCFNGSNVDAALTVNGQNAAVRLGNYLAPQAFDAIVSSPLQRARTTTDLLVQASQVPQPASQLDARLQEMDLGDWDGQPVVEQATHPEFEHYFHHPDLFDAQKLHAESYQSVLKRARAVVTEYERAYPQGDVLIVAHGIVLLFVMSDLLGVPFARIRDQKMVANASLSILQGATGHYHKQLWDYRPTEGVVN